MLLVSADAHWSGVFRFPDGFYEVSVSPMASKLLGDNLDEILQPENAAESDVLAESELVFWTQRKKAFGLVEGTPDGL